MLDQYNKKRNFGITSEPAGRAKKGQRGPLTFVIQKHDARRLHYDFRLEVDGVLVSWAVPKGPSLNPADKRFAVQTEDHPMDYASFEGVIPSGQYGAGEVIVWDKGTFTPDEDGITSWEDRDDAEKRMRKMMRNGKISIFLKGEKLQGSWALVRMKTEKDWLLIKHRDEFASERDVTKEDASVDSGRTLFDIANGRQGDAVAVKPVKAALAKAKTTKFPHKLQPMLASLSEAPYSQKGWIFEAKLDGIRALSYVKEGDVQISSRRGLDLTTQYPSLAEALSKIKRNCVLDGEIVALDEKGRPSFQLLQKRLNLSRGADIKKAEKERPIFYYIFDILYYDDKDLRSLPLSERKAILADLIVDSGKIKLVQSLGDDGQLAFRACIDHGMEGVVGKRLDAPYESGKRSPYWLKVKATQSSEFVVCGYTEGTGSRKKTFGSLILAEHDQSGDLRYVGGVGTGFDDKLIDELLSKMAQLKTKTCPLKKKPPGKLNPTWVKPELVAEVKFSERTDDHMLRHPVFLHLRDDISPQEAKPNPVVKLNQIKAAKSEDKAVKLIDDEESENQSRVEVEVKPSKGASVPDKGLKPAAPNNAYGEIFEQLNNDKEKLILQVEGNSLSLSNLNKTFWPEFGKHPAITKRDYLIYLTRVAPYLMPHLRDRPFTMIRFPNGIAEGKFYQKHVDKGLPPFVVTTRYFTEHHEKDQDFLVVNNISTLLWLAQMADLELHTAHTRIDPEPDAKHLPTDATGSVDKIQSSILNFPDYLVIDLDPYSYSGKEKQGEEPELHKEGFKQAVQCAYWLKDLLDSLKLKAFIKTSGKTGLHIFIPILRQLDYATVRALCEVLGRQLLKDHPSDVTMDWAVVKRRGKVFFDHNMNARGKTLASIYSPRVAPEACISTPLEWSELRSVYPTDFTMKTVPDRLQEKGDLWANILNEKNDLEKLLGASFSPVRTQMAEAEKKSKSARSSKRKR